MTPPSHGHTMMRDTALSLACSEPWAGALANPRQHRSSDRDTKPSLATPLAFAALEEAYVAIAEAFDAVGPDRETLFLVTLALVLARATGDIERLGSGIESARRDRDTGTGRVRRRDTGNGPGCRTRMPDQDTEP